MLNNIVQIPKINSYFLSPVVTTLGLKQGDNLSPILFNIFFDDVEEIFDEECDLVILSDDLSINHLLCADDMAILSMSSVGLQNSLNKLYTHCNKWGLKVSTIKTKVVVFNTSGRLLKDFTIIAYRSNRLKNLNTYVQHFQLLAVISCQKKN